MVGRSKWHYASSITLQCVSHSVTFDDQ